MGFRGFPIEAFHFYEGLEADNSKAYWEANKATFQEAVRGPMASLCEEVDERHQPFHIFRPNRDMRFSADKTPYKTQLGAVSEGDGGAAYYVAISARGLFVGVGYYHMASDQIERYRAAVGGARGDELAEIVAAAKARGYGVQGDALKTAPRGYPKDHPHVDLLRFKSLYGSKEFPVAAWLHTAKAKAKVEAAWADLEPLAGWLDAHVGPSTLPPRDERDVR